MLSLFNIPFISNSSFFRKFMHFPFPYLCSQFFPAACLKNTNTDPISWSNNEACNLISWTIEHCLIIEHITNHQCTKCKILMEINIILLFSSAQGFEKKEKNVKIWLLTLATHPPTVPENQR